MESFSPAGHADVPDSRRARREAAERIQNSKARSSRPRGGAHRQSHRLLGKTGVLTSLAIVTIAMPLTAAGKTEAGVSAPAAAAVADGLSTYQVLTAERAPETTPVIVADAQLIKERQSEAVSRSAGRDPVTACESRSVTSSNGRLTDSELCSLDWAPGHAQQAEAANALNALNDAYRARFGRNLCLASSYRTLGSQNSLSATKPGLAAVPGRSMHGWGIAIDLCSNSYSGTAQWNWLKANGPIFGYDNPAWARRGGSGAYEPWHWEYFPIVNSIVSY